ncbi:MAG: uracil-DNA glycosylase [Candidatus Moranbacteria bacterium RIFCSPLOWO2_02_FULL_48_19]|nr:MAG: uracil-DNA glycosylase [Candidatus Moranbacteria bacterium RIFCSPLOWO2_02_FULL_48_19]
MNKQETLDALNERMSLQCDCSLRIQATQAVPGDGSALAEILFIGEAPGKNEDLQGIPFIGAAGKFLSEMLATIELKREDIYITNIVKYRPPNNRDPLPEEISACLPWLYKQIKIIRPKIIVTLGRHAMEHFIPGKKISLVHGQAFRRALPGIGPQVFFVLYHPAAALYNGSLRATLIEDFKKIPKVLEKIKEGNHEK